MQLSLMTFMYELPLLMSGPWNEEKNAAMELILEIAAGEGFPGVDLTYSTVCAMGVERVQALLRKYRLRLTSLICFDHLADPAREEAEALAPYLDSIRVSKLLSCDHLMLVPGHVDPAVDPGLIRETIIRRSRVLVDQAAAENIQCMIENDPDLGIGMCAEADVRAVLEGVPGLKLVCDTANMIVAGEDPVAFYEALHEYTIHVHVKDLNVCDDPDMYRNEGADGVFYTSVPHDTGLVDFESVFRSFGKHHHQGILSLEFVPTRQGSPEALREDLHRIYRRFTALACRYSLGVNEVPLLSKLIPEPEEQVWPQLIGRGISGVEICILPEETPQLRAYEEEVSKRFQNPRSFARGEEILRFVRSIRSAGLEVHSAHLMFCEVYPELIAENIPYLLQVSRQTGIRQFVVSCSFETAQRTREFIPFLQQAANALKEEGVTLCYHNHHQDCTVLENGRTAFEMILEECPDIMLQLDVGWAWYGGMDPVAFMKAHGDRIASVHLKDLTEDARERSDPGRFTAIGQGCVPIRDVLDHLPLCRLSCGKLIIDQDASAGDMYDDLASGTAFVQK
ncbi:MAG: sugar phosphate isomerase/epimerase [Parasporobacterium sp.]|nr:sugar phosphate isomerase/epimerase [Parasporobacterium sp.]